MSNQLVVHFLCLPHRFRFNYKQTSEIATHCLLFIPGNHIKQMHIVDIQRISYLLREYVFVLRRVYFGSRT